MSKTLSCGVLLFNENNEILLCHVTGTHWWDIPKGCQDAGETEQETAVRETFEETGIVLKPELLLDLGYLDYRQEKALHLFAGGVPRDGLSLADCKCTSYFQHKETGADAPEVDDFVWVPFSRVAEHCANSMGKLLTQRLSLEDLAAKVAGTNCIHCSV